MTNITNLSLFSQAPAVDSAGNLTFTLAADANGYADFDVQVQDNGGTANGGVDVSSVKTYRITANPVNDAPDFTGSDIFVNEDAGAVTIANWATFTPGGGSDEATQTALYLVSNPSNPGLFTQAPAVDSAGNLTFTLAPDANGFSTFYVQVQDDGGTANGGIDMSGSQMFWITVYQVNDAPDFTASNVAVNEDDGSVTIPNWATFNPASGGDESSQLPTYIVTNIADPSLFTQLPSIDSAGELTFTLAADATGSCTFDVQVQDNGGIDRGGIDMSGVRTFTITVNPVNDAPVIANLLFTNADPKTNDLLTVQVLGASDLESDPISFTFVWAVNGIAVQTTNTTNLADSLDLALPGFGGKDDVISVTVTPSDNVQNGVPVTAIVTVGSIAPSISFVPPSGYVTNPDLADGPEESPYTEITFQIDGLAGNGAIPTGTVTFTAIDPFNGVSTFGVATVGTDGKATLQVLKAQLDHAGLLIQADYSGDDYFTATSGNDGNGSVNEDGRPDPAVIGNPAEIPADASNLTVVVVCGSGAERQAYMNQARTRYGAAAYVITSIHSIQDLGSHLASFPARSISRLVITGHGSYDVNHPSYDGDPTRGLRLGLGDASRFRASNLAQGGIATQRIHNALAPNALIVLNGCNLAETAAHRNHLIAIANVIAVPGLRIRARDQYVTGCPDSDLPNTGWHTRSTADSLE